MSKLERRVVALTECKWENNLGSAALGVVLRGNSWLDGIITHHINVTDDPTSSIVRAVRNSPHLDQLRYVIINRLEWGQPRRTLSLTVIWENLNLPVVCVVGARRAGGSSTLVHRRDGKSEVIRYCGMKDEDCRELLASGVLESLRVATLLSRNLSVTL